MDSELMGGGKTKKSRSIRALQPNRRGGKPARDEAKGFIGRPPGSFGYDPKLGSYPDLFNHLLDEVPMSERNDFKEALNSWQDIDGAMYDLAIALSILPAGTSYSGEAKHVFWSSNELGDTLHDMLEMMVKIGALEYNEEEMQYRWNPQFKWQEASSRRGR